MSMRRALKGSEITSGRLAAVGPAQQFLHAVGIHHHQIVEDEHLLLDRFD